MRLDSTNSKADANSSSENNSDGASSIPRENEGLAFADKLVREIGVATVPGSSFFRDKELGKAYVRFCFCKKDETLDEAARRLRGADLEGSRG